MVATDHGLGFRPLYQQAIDLVRRKIADGEWPAGSVLPAETRLAQDFGVSVGTVRKALQHLVDERLVERRQGVGTFVAQVTAERHLPVLESRSIRRPACRTTGRRRAVVPFPKSVRLDLGPVKGYQVDRRARAGTCDDGPGRLPARARSRSSGSPPTTLYDYLRPVGEGPAGRGVLGSRGRRPKRRAWGRRALLQLQNYIRSTTYRWSGACRASGRTKLYLSEFG